MTSAELNALHVIHVSSALGLVAATFYAFAGPPETRKKVLMWSGIATLLLLLTGIRMWQALYAFHGGWVIVKLFCWLGLSAIGGIAYRRREQVGVFAIITLVLAIVAVTMVYLKPF